MHFIGSRFRLEFCGFCYMTSEYGEAARCARRAETIPTYPA